MKFNIISDLHIDINSDYRLKLDLPDDVFTLCCGDISGNWAKTEAWVLSNIKKGAFVIGNHIGYEEPYKDALMDSYVTFNASTDSKYDIYKVISGNHYVEDTRDEIINTYKERFPIDNDVCFLENTYKIIDDYVISGCTLYTDFNLYTSKTLSERLANKYMNDFRRVRILNKNLTDIKTFKRLPSPKSYEENTIIRIKGEEWDNNFYIRVQTDKPEWQHYCITSKLTPEKTVEYHKESVQFLENVLKQFPDKNVIFVTHHAPSIKSIQEQYVKDILSAAYASDLEYLCEYPNLKLWCHGHVHSDFDYYINGTRIVCNPFGYNTSYNKETNKDNFTFCKIIEL